MLVKSLFGAFVCVSLLLPIAVQTADAQSGKGGEKKSAAPADSKSKADSSGKARGRLPMYYARVGVTESQREKIYGLQSSYAAQIESLQKQLADLEAKRDTEIRAVLTAEQKKQLEELTTGATKGKAAKKAAATEGKAAQKAASTTVETKE